MEKFKESLQVALTNLRTNAVRSMLSVLGVVIGIASVITILSLGAGARQKILDRMSTMGGDLYNLSGNYDQKTMRVGQIEVSDIDRIKELPFVITVLPNLNMYRELRSRRRIARANIRGVGSSYLKARELSIVEGRNFSPIEDEQRYQICLLNEAGARELFGDASAIGGTIYIDGAPWEVIGVYRSAGGKVRRALGLTRELEVLVPLTTLLRNAKDIFLQNLEVQVRANYQGNASEELLAAMERGDPKLKGLFLVRDQREILQKTLDIRKTLSLIGASVAGISLIVGGIGMMNVMLTSVTERTREIGVRRAVGARKKDILVQFLVESCFLSCLGGAMGLILGTAIARALPLLFPTVFVTQPQIEPSFLIVAVGSGMILGVTFGLYPAVKASRLSPAEALRSE